MLQWRCALLLTPAFLLLWTDIVRADVLCHSCFADCRTGANGRIDPTSCDCQGDTCSGPYCFAKIEIFPEEYTAVIQKGCATEIPGGQAGCQYAGHADSTHCYCEGDRCNTASSLNDFKTNPLPTVECCECSEPHGDHCPGHSCLRKCRGNYCLLDFDGIEQGCGTGYPRLQNFMRTKHYADWQGRMTCARYQASLNTIVHGCTCT
uniref:Uncharacterized protein n=1 Tax=Plectus sambesii TaxID=2011161 RepID=A0A914V9H4_9BILA